MEFREFSNPEGRDYDITSSLKSGSVPTKSNPYVVQLMDLIGILEDITDEDLKEQYGINMNEYLNPTRETIEKVSQKLNSEEIRKYR